MPNGDIQPVEGCFNIVRCISVSDRRKLNLLAKLLGINARKAAQMEVGNVYISQDCNPKQPAKREGCNPDTTLAPGGGTRRAAAPKNKKR